ncbi:unnamed protein product [Aspergillus oryzae var. brunneus]|uniref:Unnamed protein product n=1 Tax=Aspergillus oryzae var. brunneus TaxID=332754 RepID=A0ABQ6L9I6_ASPOZ|nr:unnamed protein product [Aspergillus oryzae var. brunneus]
MQREVLLQDDISSKPSSASMQDRDHGGPEYFQRLLYLLGMLTGGLPSYLIESYPDFKNPSKAWYGSTSQT